MSIQYREYAGGVEVSPQDFVYEKSRFVISQPFDARLSCSDKWYTLVLPLNADAKKTIRAAAFDTLPQAVEGLLKNMAWLYNAHPELRRNLEGIIRPKN